MYGLRICEIADVYFLFNSDSYAFFANFYNSYRTRFKTCIYSC